MHESSSMGRWAFVPLRGHHDLRQRRHAGPCSDANEGDQGSDWGDEAAALGDAESLSDWGATDDGTGSRPGSAAPSPDRRPSASLFFSLFTMHSSQQ